MRITVTNYLGDVQTYDLDSVNTTVRALKETIAPDMHIPPQAQVLQLNGKVLAGDENVSLLAAGIAQDDLILVMPNPASAPGRGPSASSSAAAPSSVPSQAQIETVRVQLLGNPAALAQLQRQNPALAQAVSNPPEFARLLTQFETEQRRLAAAKQAEWEALANADPFDIEAQRKIEEAIAQKNVHQNMETAMEYNPESFARVHMLYINCEVNGHPVKAFVDSGAQTTIMSPDMAEKCKIMRLLDARFSGIAKGVGSAKILGRIHSTQLKLGKSFFPCSFTVIEGQDVDMLLGLDMLKRYQACIDLASNSLKLAGEEIPFLAEHELPEKARLEGPASTSPSAPAAESSSHPVQPPMASSSAPARHPPTTASSSVPPSSAPQQSKYPPMLIRRFVDMGATEADVIHALDAAGGNVDLVADILFGGGF